MPVAPNFNDLLKGVDAGYEYVAKANGAKWAVRSSTQLWPDWYALKRNNNGTLNDKVTAMAKTAQEVEQQIESFEKNLMALTGTTFVSKTGKSWRVMSSSPSQWWGSPLLPNHEVDGSVRLEGSSEPDVQKAIEKYDADAAAIAAKNAAEAAEALRVQRLRLLGGVLAVTTVAGVGVYLWKKSEYDRYRY